MDENIVSITSFRTAGEYFGVETMKIEHILENVTPTAVPLSKSYIRGVINNHGNMVPVIDFRLLIGQEADDNQPEASIIILSVDGTNETLIGFKVDQVDEVFDADEKKISKDVLIEVEKSVQKAFCGTISNGDKYIYRINLDELTNVIEQ